MCFSCRERSGVGGALGSQRDSEVATQGLNRPRLRDVGLQGEMLPGWPQAVCPAASFLPGHLHVACCYHAAITKGV